MSFIWPPALALVLLVPLGWWLYSAIGARRSRRLRKAYGAAEVTRTADPRGGRGRIGARLPAVLIAGGLVIMTVALARPQAVVALPRQEGAVILAFDVSGSMVATDISPTRLAAAQAAAKDFVARQPDGISIGIVAFSDAGVSIQTPTTDQAEVMSAIDRLAAQKGTSVAAGINASLDAIAAYEAGPYGGDYYTNRTPAPGPTATPTPVPAGYHAPAVIVLLSDGENNEQPSPLTAAQTAANEGVRIFTVGLGSSAGTDLDVNGVHVHTSLDAATLQQIAQTTGGTYYSATDATQLLNVYDNLDTQLVVQPQLTELTAIFAGLAVLMLAAGGLGSMLSVGRLP
jgi:Ca-activated chloride channel family protein